MCLAGVPICVAPVSKRAVSLSCFILDILLSGVSVLLIFSWVFLTVVELVAELLLHMNVHILDRTILLQEVHCMPCVLQELT